MTYHYKQLWIVRRQGTTSVESQNFVSKEAQVKVRVWRWLLIERLRGVRGRAPSLGARLKMSSERFCLRPPLKNLSHHWATKTISSLTFNGPYPARAERRSKKLYKMLLRNWPI